MYVHGTISNAHYSTVLSYMYFLHTSHVSCVPSPTKNPEFFHVFTLSVGSVYIRR